MTCEILLKLALIISFSFSPLFSQAIPGNVKSFSYFEKTGSSIPGSIISTSYIDGFGRPIQNQLFVNDSNFSLTTSTLYDNSGRPSTVLVPFISAGSSYVADPMSASVSTNGQYSYSGIYYSGDPLDRIVTQTAPGREYSIDGDGLGLHYTTKWYFGVSNKECIPCSQLTISGLNNRQNETSAKYYLTVSKDQNGNYSQVLNDKFRRTLLTWSHPDQRGKAGTASCNDALAIVNQYDYDTDGNVIVETPPNNGIPASSSAYNTIGQLIWSYTPDQGTVNYYYTPTGQLSLVVDQKMKDTLSLDPALSTYGLECSYDFAGRLTCTYLHKKNTSNVDSYQIKIRNFYDNPASALDYICPSNSSNQELMNLRTILTDPQTNSGNVNYPQNTRGKLAVTISYGENCTATSTLTDNCATFSDRVIEVYSYNDEGAIVRKWKYIPSLPLQETQYTYDNIEGKLKQEITIFRTLSAGSDQRATREYHYDSNNRLDMISLNGTPAVVYRYDKQGRMSVKSFLTTNNIKADTVAYSYAWLRDWISSIKSNSFSENITYLDNSTTSLADKDYSGNISSTTVTQRTDTNSVINLKYKYDDVSRLINVTHVNPAISDKRFDASYSYDAQGRFVNKQEGLNVLSGYNYEVVPGTNLTNNRLSNITSKTNKVNVYDPNGNLVLDRNKKMGIIYDWRNLPVEFRFYQTIPDVVNWYDAGKLEKVNGVKLLSVVSMLYDASGSRVLKRESKPKPSIENILWLLLD